jgi:hypothetical protein
MSPMGEPCGEDGPESRSVRPPIPVQMAGSLAFGRRARASLKDGLLTLTLPKAEEVQPTQGQGPGFLSLDDAIRSTTRRGPDTRGGPLPFTRQVPTDRVGHPRPLAARRLARRCLASADRDLHDQFRRDLPCLGLDRVPLAEVAGWKDVFSCGHQAN